VVVKINGRVRDRMTLSIRATEEEIKTAALANQKIQQLLAGKTVQRIIVVPKKLVNIVVN
jgi:leucyl-tRNA synthetase